MLRLSLLLLLFASVILYCASHCYKRRHPKGANECAALGDISRGEFEAASLNSSTAYASPTVADGRAYCSGPTPYFFYINKDGWILFAAGMQCAGGQWFVDRLDAPDRFPYETTNVRCSD